MSNTVHVDYVDRMERRLLSQQAVCAKLGLSRQELWRRRRAGSFPQAINLGGRRVAYDAAEVEAWIEARVAERDAREAARRID